MTVHLSQAELSQIAARHQTISDKARALTDAGCSIGQIAKLLDRSYQQIRQVVKSYEARKIRDGQIESGSAHSRAGENKIRPPAQHGASAVFRFCASEDGSLTVPRHALEAAGIQLSDVIIGVVEGGQLVLKSAQASMDQAQELVRTLLPGNDSLAASLIADRRCEVAEEQLHG